MKYWCTTKRRYQWNLQLLFETFIIMVVKSRRVRWAGCRARMKDIGNTYRILVEKPLRKHQPGRFRMRMEVDGTGSRLSPAAGFGISGAEP